MPRYGTFSECIQAHIDKQNKRHEDSARAMAEARERLGLPEGAPIPLMALAMGSPKPPKATKKSEEEIDYQDRNAAHRADRGEPAQ